MSKNKFKYLGFDTFISTKRFSGTKKYFKKFMITLNQNYQNPKNNSKIQQIQGICISDLNSSGEVEIIFQKGLCNTCIKKIIDLYKGNIFENRQGYIKGNLGNLNVYICYFEKTQGKKTIIIFVDKEKNGLNYSRLNNFSEKLFIKRCLNASISDIECICNRTIEIPRAKGIIGILILDKRGLLFFSKVNKKRKNISKNIFQIAGFISALLIYSQDFIGSEESGLKLEDIDLGNHHLYVNMKNDVIFAYLVEKNNSSESIERYMHVIVENFLNKYYNTCVKNFNGNLAPFHEFEQEIDQYFEI